LAQYTETCAVLYSRCARFSGAAVVPPSHAFVDLHSHDSNYDYIFIARAARANFCGVATSTALLVDGRSATSESAASDSVLDRLRIDFKNFLLALV